MTCAVKPDRKFWGGGSFAFKCATANGRQVGYIQTQLRRDPKTNHDFFEVNGITVAPKHRRSGIGTRLYEAAAKEACRQGAPLASRYRDEDASTGFWKKQLKKGRARVVDKRGGIHSGAGRDPMESQSFLHYAVPRHDR